MARRRAPAGFPQRVSSAIESMTPGTVGGRVRNASPVPAGDSSDARAAGSGDSGANDNGLDFYRDRFALASDGAQDLTLTYSPLDYSVHVYLNGIEQDEDTDYSLDGTTLSIESPMAALTGDVVDVRYAYLVGGVAGAEILVDFFAAGWLYKPILASDSTDYSGAALSDSSWSTGQAPFGGSNYDSGLVVNNTDFAENERIWLRRHFGSDIPSGTVKVYIRVNNYIAVWWNGNLVFDGGTTDYFATLTNFTGVPLELNVDPSYLGGDNVIAIRATDNPGGTPTPSDPSEYESWYIDAKVTVE